jgi:L-ascorbate metabolism protein UlaG (beta-lactamase superfamily)
MKKPWKYALALLPIPIYLLITTSPSPGSAQMTYISNPDLLTVKNDPTWKGTPVDGSGKFVNMDHPFESSFKDFLKWQWSTNPQKAAKKSETRVPLVEDGSGVLEGDEDFIMWLGHASYLIRLQGKVMLTDPVIFDSFFLKRDHPLPIQLAQFPPIDYLLLSHNHRDHCDQKSIKHLALLNPDMQILTGLGVGNVISSWINGNVVQEAGWYQQYGQTAEIEITYVPTRHWSKRWLNDDNTSLWGGFYIRNGNETIYFMGDSGKGPHFEDIKETLGRPNYCLMGIGAFKPEWFMHQGHISPKDAIEAFNSLGGTYFIPMHYGTFDLSDEPRMEPWDIVLENQKEIQGVLVEPVVGRNLMFSE